MSLSIPAIIDEALQQYGAETARLLPVAENRYNRSLFLTTGQYDWFSAQVLYCVIRHLKPQTIIEVSTSSGYSTVIQASALKHNQCGRLHTFEIDPKSAASADRALRHFAVSDWVTIHLGDARTEAAQVKELVEPALLFLDSLHTEAFARWFIEQWVQAVSPDTWFHIHDVMPPTARVRFNDGPPWQGAWKNICLDLARRLAGRPTRQQLGHVTRQVFPPAQPGELPTTDGVITTEAIIVNRLIQRMPTDSFAYLYDLPRRYPELQPRRFDAQTVKRQNRQGQPMEWNETVWLHAGEFMKAYRRTV